MRPENKDKLLSAIEMMRKSGQISEEQYQMAKQTYEAGFMSFLGTKFSAEYVNSPDGKVAAENLLSTIRKSKEFIQSQIKAKEEKVNTLLELMESDPEMKKRFDELMMNKTAK